MSMITISTVNSLGDWKVKALQLINDGRWEDALFLWESNFPVRIICQWFATIFMKSGDLAEVELGRMIIEWFNEPKDSLRWKIFEHAELIGFDNPVGALGASVFLLDGSMAPEGLEPVYPDPKLSGKMLHSSLLAYVCITSDTPSDGVMSLLSLWPYEE